MKASDAIIKEWAERHDLQGTLTDLRACFDDARSLSGTPPVDTSTAGERHDTWLHKATMDIRVIDPSAGGRAHEQIYDVLERLLESRLAALREQLAQKERDYVELKRGMWKRLNEMTEKVEQQQAALKQAQKFKAFVHDYLTQHGVPEGDPTNQHQIEGCRIGARLDLLLGQLTKTEAALKQKDEKAQSIRDEAIALKDVRKLPNSVIHAEAPERIRRKATELLAIQPDSTALKTFSEAEKAELRQLLKKAAPYVGRCIGEGTAEESDAAFNLSLSMTAALADSAQKAGQPANAT